MNNTTIERLNTIFPKSLGITSGVTNSGEYQTGKKNPLDHFINYSGVLTKLIQEAGTVTANYASDLFISWECFLKEAEKKMESQNDFEITTFFGFRENGVDGPEYISLKLSSPEIYGSPYISIFRLNMLANFSVDDRRYDVSLALTQVYRREIYAPIYTGTNKNGSVITGYLLYDASGAYLLPRESFARRTKKDSYSGAELSEMKLYSVDPGTIRRA